MRSRNVKGGRDVVYITVMMLSILGALLFTRVSKRCTVYMLGSKRFEIRYQKVFAWLCVFLPLFLVSAFRYGVGTDYFYTYTPIFNRIRGIQDLMKWVLLGSQNS